MTYKDLINFVGEETTLSKKQLTHVLKRVGKFFNKVADNKAPFKWKGVINIGFITTKETKRILNNKTINVPSKVKAKIKLA